MNMPAPEAGPTARPRVVAIGDLHSDIGSTRSAFQLAGATDANDIWIGGTLEVVQLGDMIGRSDDERQVLDFLFDVRQQARAAGGSVHLLVGNHEVMGGRVDNQAVGANPFPGYEDVPDLNLADPRVEFLPQAQKKRGAALMAGGPYAQRFAELPTVLQLGGTVFVHGGVVPRWAQYGIDRINAEVSDWLFGDTAEPDSSLGVDDGDRVMWTRQFSSLVDESDCAVLDESLAILGAKRMIVAHTVQPTITGYCDNKVWAVDVGMSRYYGGPIEVLELVNDETLTVLSL
jgi:Calcineurin-like phosphoesterase